MLDIEIMDIEMFILKLTILIVTVVHCYHFINYVFKNSSHEKGDSNQFKNISHLEKIIIQCYHFIKHLSESSSDFEKRNNEQLKNIVCLEKEDNKQFKNSGYFEETNVQNTEVNASKLSDH